MSGPLRVGAFRVFSGAFEVLHGIDLHLAPGAALGLVGPNGAGKSTLLRGIIGLAPSRGSLALGDVDLSDAPLPRRLSAGLVLCPGERAVFPEMSVGESIRMGAYLRRDHAGVERDLERVRAAVPRMDERWTTPAGSLSGGEQRMLGILTALMSRPRYLLLDEPSAGLSPDWRARLVELIRNDPLGGRPGLIVAEQNLQFVLSLCDGVAVLRRGGVDGRYSTAQVAADPALRRRVQQLM